MARARWLGLPAPTPQHTVQELVAEYLAKVTPRKSPASQRRDHVVLERFRKRWGTLDLDQLSNKTVEDYLTERLHDVTLATVSKDLGILKSAYGRALRWDWVSTTPFRGIALNQEGEERVRWLTDEEEAHLVATAAPWLREFILVGLDTGLRRRTRKGDRLLNPHYSRPMVRRYVEAILDEEATPVSLGAVAIRGGGAPFSMFGVVRWSSHVLEREIHDTRLLSDPSAPPFCTSPGVGLAWDRNGCLNRNRRRFRAATA